MKADPNTRILEYLYKSFTDNLEEDDSLEVKLLMPEESGLETPVLTTLHHSFGTTANLAEGAFFFEDDVFVARVLLAPEVPAENLPALCVLISLMNAELPAGTFCYDQFENALAYYLKTPIVDGLDEKARTALCDRCTAIALSLAAQNSGDLIRCAYGS